MKAAYEAICKACYLENGLSEIKKLKDTFDSELDLAFEDNFALRTAIERNDSILASYLLTDADVLEYEAKVNFPCLRLAIDKKSPIVQLFLVGVNFVDSEISIPADLLRMANELKRREKEKVSTTPVADQSQLIAFSSFRSNDTSQIEGSLVSAQNQSIPRKGILKLLFCG